MPPLPRSVRGPLDHLISPKLREHKLADVRVDCVGAVVCSCPAHPSLIVGWQRPSQCPACQTIYQMNNFECVVKDGQYITVRASIERTERLIR